MFWKKCECGAWYVAINGRGRPRVKHLKIVLSSTPERDVNSRMLVEKGGVE